MRNTIIALVMAVAAAALGGCASDRMLDLKTVPAAVSSPLPDKATVVFFRPSFFGGAVQSTVFDVTDNDVQFVGIVSAGKKISHTVSPGQRRFMALGENADFIDVDAGEGKIYHARISPRLGLWKARFALEPVAASKAGLSEELAGCNWVENTAQSRDWAVQNMVSILEKKAAYLPDWETNPDRGALRREDGK